MFATVLRFGMTLGAIALLFLAVMITVDVIMRFVTGVPITGVFEVAELLLLAVTFLTLPYLHFRSQEMNVDLLRAHATGLAAKTLSFFDAVIAMAFFAVLTWDASRDFLTALERGYTGRGLIRIPSVIPLGLVVMGAALTVVALAVRRYRPPTTFEEMEKIEVQLADEKPHGQ